MNVDTLHKKSRIAFWFTVVSYALAMIMLAVTLSTDGTGVWYFAMLVFLLVFLVSTFKHSSLSRKYRDELHKRLY